MSGRWFCGHANVFESKGSNAGRKNATWPRNRKDTEAGKMGWEGEQQKKEKIQVEGAREGSRRGLCNCGWVYQPRSCRHEQKLTRGVGGEERDGPRTFV